MIPEDFNIYELISSLQGSCQTIQEALPEGMSEDELTEEHHNAIDNEIFRCVQCDWWYDLGEQSQHEDYDEEYCESCGNDQ